MFLSRMETVDKAHNTTGELASHPSCGHLEKPPTPEDTTMVTEEEEGPRADGWYLAEVIKMMSFWSQWTLHPTGLVS